MCIINFLNQNSGAITIILTMTLALINIFQWILAQKLRKDANSPKVLANIEGISGEIYYKLMNFGTTSALDINIKVDSNMLNQMQPTDYNRQKLERLATGKFPLLPGGVVYISTGHLWEEIKETPISISYSYKDVSGKRYSEHFTFNTSVLDVFEYKGHNEQTDDRLKKDIRDLLKVIAQNKESKRLKDDN